MMEPYFPKMEKCAIITNRFKHLKDTAHGVGQETEKFFDPTEESIKWSIRLFPNGYPSKNRESRNDVLSLRIIYHGGERKVTARFVLELCRTKEEYKAEVEPLIKKETTRFRFSSEAQSLNVPGFISHKVLFNPEYKLLPFGSLILRVKVFYSFDAKVVAASKKLIEPSRCNRKITLVIGNKEYKNYDALPLQKCSKIFNEKLQDPSVTHLHFGKLSAPYVRLILQYVYGYPEFDEYLDRHPYDKTLQRYAEKLQIDKLIMLLTRVNA